MAHEMGLDEFLALLDVSGEKRFWLVRRLWVYSLEHLIDGDILAGFYLSLFYDLHREVWRCVFAGPIDEDCA